MQAYPSRCQSWERINARACAEAISKNSHQVIANEEKCTGQTSHKKKKRKRTCQVKLQDMISHEVAIRTKQDLREKEGFTTKTGERSKG